MFFFGHGRSVSEKKGPKLYEEGEITRDPDTNFSLQDQNTLSDSENTSMTAL